MGSGNAEKLSKSSLRNRNPKRKRLPLGPNRPKKTEAKSNKNNSKNINFSGKKKDESKINHRSSSGSSRIAAAEQLSFFVDQYQSALGIQLSSLELEPIKDKCILELSQGFDQSASNLGDHMKAAFGSSWKEVLCEKHLLEGKIDPGNPAVLVIGLSALRSLELLRGLRALTKDCPAAKLFSKHMKIDDQVLSLPSMWLLLVLDIRVNT
ncbi:hypothetical protein U1Q18_030532 [Sarracenia purpurea var. burkii]